MVVSGVKIFGILAADGVDGLADVVALVVVRRLVDHQPVLVAALQHLLYGGGIQKKMFWLGTIPFRDG